MIMYQLKNAVERGFLTPIHGDTSSSSPSTYTLLPTGNVYCDTEVINSLDHHLHSKGHCCGYFIIAIEFDGKKNNFKIQEVFFGKKSSHIKLQSGINAPRISEVYPKRSNAKQMLFLFQGISVLPDVACLDYFNQLTFQDDLLAIDVKNNLAYVQVRLTVISNQKELFFAFHNTQHFTKFLTIKP